MKICVYGCGAIGSLIAVRLAATDADVRISVVARGPHLDAIRANGLQLLPVEGGEPELVRVTATDDPAELGEQDIVFLTMKSHAVPAIVDKIAPLLGTHTLVVTAANGIPWWYFHGLPGDVQEIASVDPGLKLWNAIGPRRAIGCVAYPAAKIESPGVVRHVFGDRLTIGVPDGSSRARVNELAKLLESAGFVAPVQDDIRIDIWTKLIANAAFNPVSVMTGKTLGEMIDDEATCGLLRKIMAEAVAVAAAYGVAPAMSPEELLEATRQLGGHKTSMLQDLEAGRGLELGPIVGAVIELAGMRGVPVPNLTMAYELAAARAAA